MEPDFSTLDPLRQQAQTAGQNVAAYTQAGAELPGKLREALNKKFTTDNPLYEQRGRALSGYLTAAEGAQKELLTQQQSSLPFSPTQLRYLQGQREAAALVPLVNINSILAQATGTIPETIAETGQAFQGQTQAAQAQAQLAQQNYGNALNELVQKAEITRQNRLLQLQEEAARAPQKADTQVVEANRRKYLVNTQTGQVIADLGAAPQAAGSADTLSPLLAGILGGAFGTSTPEAKPQRYYNPYTGKYQASGNIGPVRR